MTIKDKFKPSYGDIVSIRNVCFESLDDFRKNLGESIGISHREDSSTFSLDEYGAYVYRSKYDFTKALKIYKDFNFYKYTSYSDYKIVSRLQEKQPNIQLSKFPTGILTIQDYVIGQEIPFYDNSETIHDYFVSGNMKKRQTQFYLDVLKILKELCNQGIIYTDVHIRNFMVNRITEIVNIIDFDSAFINFDNLKSSYIAMLNNLKICIISGLNLTRYSDLSYELDDKFRKAYTLEQTEQILLEIDNKLKIK